MEQVTESLPSSVVEDGRRDLLADALGELDGAVGVGLLAEDAELLAAEARDRCRCRA